MSPMDSRSAFVYRYGLNTHRHGGQCMVFCMVSGFKFKVESLGRSAYGV